jgi:hypothetical protein
VLVDPFERLIDQREGAIAAGGLSTVHSGRPMTAVAGCVGLSARVGLVEGVGVYVWRLSAPSHDSGSTLYV